MNLDVASARSLRIADPDRLARLDRVNCIIVVGSSCAGKTTLVDEVRRSELVATQQIDVPMRYVTRPARMGESELENLHVSETTFEERVLDGEIAVHWRRDMDHGRVIRYGFRAPRPGSFPIYSANNAILRDAARLHPREVLARALVIGVSAPGGVRADRLKTRSPELSQEEVDHRLADDVAAVEPRVHLWIANHAELEPMAKREIVWLAAHVLGAAEKTTSSTG